MITKNQMAITLEEEHLLVERAQNGDRSAMDRLLGAHYQQMYHLALKITRDPVRAEDVTQEACVQVLRRIEQFRSEARFSSWLCRIVVNTALLRHRREKRLVPTDDLQAPQSTCQQPLPERSATTRQLLEMTDAFLDTLRDGDRDLFVRRFIDGLSLQRISDETGLSLPALKSRFHRARLRLKDECERAEWGISVSV